mmetsp:Transcript_27267/g.79470  ORF Transcript_27267/g.79470 Transcript_27267/m.79470 type:complete len:250 (-) Transcript_27267:1280-2029(-)
MIGCDSPPTWKELMDSEVTAAPSCSVAPPRAACGSEAYWAAAMETGPSAPMSPKRVSGNAKDGLAEEPEDSARTPATSGLEREDVSDMTALVEASSGLAMVYASSPAARSAVMAPLRASKVFSSTPKSPAICSTGEVPSRRRRSSLSARRLWRRISRRRLVVVALSSSSAPSRIPAPSTLESADTEEAAAVSLTWPRSLKALATPAARFSAVTWSLRVKVSGEPLEIKSMDTACDSASSGDEEPAAEMN